MESRAISIFTLPKTGELGSGFTDASRPRREGGKAAGKSPDLFHDREDERSGLDPVGRTQFGQREFVLRPIQQ